MRLVLASVLAAGLLAVVPARAGEPQPAPAKSTAPAKPQAEGGAGKTVGDIVSQPVRDVGVAKVEIPPPLVEAAKAPYASAGVRSCRQIARALDDLNGPLGPDFGSPPQHHESRAGKLVEAGGRSVVNSLIPFRSLVREVSGAAPAQRRLDEAIDAGYARRGFLRGLYVGRGCKPALRG